MRLNPLPNKPLLRDLATAIASDERPPEPDAAPHRIFGGSPAIP
jgi:hypothetical protein